MQHGRRGDRPLAGILDGRRCEALLDVPLHEEPCSCIRVPACLTLATVQAKNPKRDLPIAIIGSLTLATILVRLVYGFKHSYVSYLRVQGEKQCHSDAVEAGPKPKNQ